MTTLDIITVTYRSTDLALRCIDSVLANIDPSIKVRMIVLDNDSGDGTADAVARVHPGVEVVRRGENSGFAVACNQGIEMTFGDYVLLLNPDTELRAGVVEHLVDLLQSDPTIGLVGPRLEKADGTFDHAAKRNSPGPVEAFRYLLGRQLGRTPTSGYLAPEVGEHDIGDVDAINGAFMLAPRTAIERVGLLDEKYWMYGEDLDWCRRFRTAGYRVVYDGRVSAVHLKGGSSGKFRAPRVNWHFHRSMWLYYRDEPRQAASATTGVVALGIGVHWCLTSIRWVASRIKRQP